ncbi:putative plastid lipid-associated protein/fibrillin [Lupinus albus]|uniref:Putative plastid lipid-associated protein/fibrillin n=1 Tax=Lupinus albus TaxID=3870 RepID=A0A6A4NRA3_LUPAL|nr:putative plastid lipid-associated protein/fibrillin [Lupinus albus]
MHSTSFDKSVEILFLSSPLYTSFRSLFPLLSQAIGPFIRVGDISQTIDSETYAVQNSVQFVSPLTTTNVTSNGKYEVRSPKRVQVKIEERVIGAPQLTESLTIPEEIEFIGQKIDLTPLKGILHEKAKKIASKPPVRLPIPRSFAESWLLTTYLDEDIRVSRGDYGTVLVFIKEGSSLLTS